MASVRLGTCFVLCGCVAAQLVASPAWGDAGVASCATATSHWSAPVFVSDTALRAGGVRRGVAAPFDIVIEAGPGLAGNAAALASWERAAAEWEAIITDPVTVTVEADLVVIDEPGVLGQTDAVTLTGSVAEVRDAMAQSAVTETDEGITAALPTEEQLRLLLAPNTFSAGLVTASKANLKALGFTDLDEQFGAADARVDF